MPLLENCFSQPHGGGAVMEKERNLGVTEARFALTLLTCLLVAIGYVALLRLGGSKDTAVEPGSDDVPPPGIAGPATTTPSVIEPPPIVLPLEKPDDGQIERTSQRPKRVIPAPQSPDPERR
jgi:hypothetical protein